MPRRCASPARKLTDKIYYQHTGYIGNIKQIALEKLLKEHPERVIEFAVKGMLPKNPLGRQHVQEAPRVRGRQAPAQRPAAQAAGDLS